MGLFLAYIVLGIATIWWITNTIEQNDDFWTLYPTATIVTCIISVFIWPVILVVELALNIRNKR